MKKWIWITWENQRRNKTLSHCLGAELIQIEISGNRLLRYFISMVKTLNYYITKSPKLIFVQNPSIILAFISVLYCRMFSIPIIVDAHNSGINPLLWWKKKSVFYRFIGDTLTKIIIRLSNMTIVTNEKLANYVTKLGGRSFVLQDPLPVLKSYDENKLSLKGKYNLLFICTYSEDEPYEAVIEAGRLICDEIYIYISGNNKKIKNSIEGNLPKNVIMTGFLPDDLFIQMIYSCDAVIVLTTVDDCLVCGAYEAVAAGKPCILSCTEKLMDYFKDCAIYTDNSPADIAVKIKYVMKNKEDIISKLIYRREMMRKEWNIKKDALEVCLEEMDKQ